MVGDHVPCELRWSSQPASRLDWCKHAVCFEVGVLKPAHRKPIQEECVRNGCNGSSSKPVCFGSSGSQNPFSAAISLADWTECVAVALQGQRSTLLSNRKVVWVCTLTLTCRTWVWAQQPITSLAEAVLVRIRTLIVHIMPKAVSPCMYQLLERMKCELHMDP